MTAEDAAHWVLQYAEAVNDLGQIVGEGLLDGEGAGFRYTPGYDDGGTWVPAVVEAMGLHDGDATTIDSIGAFGINNFGDVTGDYNFHDANSNLIAQGVFLYTDEAGTIDLGQMTGYHTYAVDINDNMEIVGRAHDGNLFHAFHWTAAGGFEDLGYFKACGGNGGGQAAAINEFGGIVGDATAGCKPGGIRAHAFRYSAAGGMMDLGTFGGDMSNANDLNDGGVVVGTAQTRDGTYQSYIDADEFGMIALTPLIVNPTADYASASPHRINNAGQICATGYSGPGPINAQAILLTPIAQP
jgi:probable HAF family extracellular repeat protein